MQKEQQMQTVHSVWCARVEEVMLGGEYSLHYEGFAQPIPNLGFLLRAVRAVKKGFSSKVTLSGLFSRKIPVLSGCVYVCVCGGWCIRRDVPLRRLL
jgi:hypothetical protein